MLDLPALDARLYVSIGLRGKTRHMIADHMEQTDAMTDDDRVKDWYLKKTSPICQSSIWSAADWLTGVPQGPAHPARRRSLSKPFTCTASLC